MKNIARLLLVMIIALSFIGCVKQAPQPLDLKPELPQAKTIFELATMDIYYHNVAKYEENDASGALLWKKDRKFWIEYTGVVRVGIDAALVTMEVEEDRVMITLPEARILSSKVDEATLTEDSFIVAKGSAKVKAEHQTEAYKEAQRKMEEAASDDAVLLANAQHRAQSLLEDYVNNIGNAVGKEYTIRWIYLDGMKDLDSKD